MTTIAPCPCGAKADWDAARSGDYYVCCSTPGCWLGPLADTKDDAIAVWNRLSAAVTLARHMAAWLTHLSHWTELPDDAVVLAVTSPDLNEVVRITAGMIRDAAGC